MKFKWFALFCILIIAIFSIQMLSLPANVSAQQPTGSIPTVTGTPRGVIGSVKIGLTEDRVNIRSGPNVLYPLIGVILLGDQVPVLGKSIGGDWLVVQYHGVPGGIGWVWSLYMDLTPGELPVFENPPSPVPITTVTIDPTMAAQFITTPQATRLPTFTEPAPLSIPTFDSSTGQALAGIPIGMVIVLLSVLGILLGLLSYFQMR